MPRDAASDRQRAWGGVALSLSAAATFGIFAPAAKAATSGLDPLHAAGLTYLVAGLVAAAAVGVRRLAGAHPAGRRIVRGDLPRLLAMVLAGGVIGPALFFAGVRRLAGHDAAILQHVEFFLTILAAVLILGERVGRRGAAGLALVASGLILFASAAPVEAGHAGASREAGMLGMLLVAAAALAWAVDNTLARGASDLDPLVVVSCKGLGAACVLLPVSGGMGPLSPRVLSALALAGGAGVALSLVLELLALRRVGAALNAGLFATGPAFGFLWSLLLLGERAGAWEWTALLMCAAGAVALAVDRHTHWHVHGAIEHTHRHHHPDPSHTHDHGPGVDPASSHVHLHRHEAVRHSHPHVHDAEHRHGHPPAESEGGIE